MPDRRIAGSPHRGSPDRPKHGTLQFVNEEFLFGGFFLPITKCLVYLTDV